MHGPVAFRARLILLAVLLAVGCRRDETGARTRASQVTADPGALAPTAAPSFAPTPASSGPRGEAPSTPDVEDFEGTAGTTEKNWADRLPTKLVAVRAARHARFDRVVFEFSGRVPGFHVEYIDRPVRRCGSGEVVPISGDGWLEVRLSPADAHDEKGRPLAGERERKIEIGVLRELELTCDLEGVVTWVLGVGSPNRYRILELSDPPRLVVDVRHR